MRCPKCSFISFDDLATCAKCSNDLAELSAELNGSCTEERLPFFLSAVIQPPEADETFADEQESPVIDDADVSFDDSGEIPADDISLELGDIMPVDLDQLDEPLDRADESVELSLDDLGDSLSSDDIDLDLSGDFDASDFDATEAVELGDVDLDKTSLVLEPLSLDIDDDLQETLTGEFPALDSGATEALDLGDEPFDADATGDSFGLDEDLLAELQTDSNEDLTGGESLPDIGDDLADFALDDTDVGLKPVSDGGSFDADDTFSGGESLDLDADLLAELQAGAGGDLTGGESLADIGDDFTLDEKSIDLESVSEGESFDADDTFSGGESLGLDADLLAELQAGSEDNLTGDEVLTDTGADLKSTSDGGLFDADATLSGRESFDLGAELRETMTGEFPALDSDATEAIEPDDELASFDLDGEIADPDPVSDSASGDDTLIFDGSPLEALSFNMDDEESTDEEPEPVADSVNGDDTLIFDDSPLDDLSFDLADDELPATSDDGLELGSDQQDEELTLDDSPLEDLSLDTEDEISLDEELLASPDAEPVLDLAGLESDSQDEELALDDSPLGDFSLDTEDDEQLGDELLATMDDELGLDPAELESDSQDEELTLDGAPVENLTEDTEEELLGDAFSLAADDDALDLDLDQQDDEVESEEINAAPVHSSSAVLEQIDVSDLISSAEDESLSALDDEEIDLSSLMEEDEENDDSAIDMLDEDIPEMELVEDDGDDDEGPPDLP